MKLLEFHGRIHLIILLLTLSLMVSTSFAAIPKYIESEIFIVTLNDFGRLKTMSMRPSDKPDEAFSILFDSAVTREEVDKLGKLVGHHKTVLFLDSESKSSSTLFEAVDIVPISAHSGDYDFPLGSVKVGFSVKLDLLKASDDSLRMNSNIVISNIESLNPLSASLSIPHMSVLSASKIQDVSLGRGFMIGGFKNIGEVQNEDEFLVLINVNSMEQH